MVLKFISAINAAAPLSMVLKHCSSCYASLQRSDIIFTRCVNTFLFRAFLPKAGTAASLEECARFLSFHELSELTQALPGFLMLVTGEGKLLYLSDSVSEHLGHSMVSLLK